MRRESPCDQKNDVPLSCWMPYKGKKILLSTYLCVSLLTWGQAKLRNEWNSDDTDPIVNSESNWPRIQVWTLHKTRHDCSTKEKRHFPPLLLKQMKCNRRLLMGSDMRSCSALFMWCNNEELLTKFARKSENPEKVVNSVASAEFPSWLPPVKQLGCLDV